MKDDLNLFESAKGSPLQGYLLLKSRGKNVPGNWIERYNSQRKALEKELKKVLQNQNLSGYSSLAQWEVNFQKEMFYTGIRALLEIERKGKTKY
jgi:predicted nucleic acid-binding Zn ribbon protein